MTLLEAVIAFVLLSVVGVVCLDQSRGASQLQVRSAEWTRAVALAESALAESAFGEAATPDAAAAGGDRATTRVRVVRRPWRAGIDVLEASVPLTHGGTFTLQRLAPAAGGVR